MFGAKYSRLKFWTISMLLLFLGADIKQYLRFHIATIDNDDTIVLLELASLLIVIVWLNTLANRIRDYGSSPWLSLFALIPLVNTGLAIYYGIVKHKKVSSDNTMSNNSKSQSIEENESIISMDSGNDDKIYEQVSSREEANKVKVATAEPTVSNTTNEQISDDELYEQALLETEEDKKVKSVWAKALAKSDGDRDKAEALYIQYRVHTIIETKKKILQYKTDFENGKLLKSMKNILLKDGYYQYSEKTVCTKGFDNNSIYEAVLDFDKMILKILGDNGKPVVLYPLK